MLSKDRHYWTQLRLALTSGQWLAKYPAKAPNGTALPWSELFRKFNKHCKGFQDVAHVASETHRLALLLAANYRDEDEDDTPLHGGNVYPLELGQECLLPEERIEEAQQGYESLKSLKTSNYDTLNFALAYYAYALGNPSECLEHLSKVPDMLNLRNHIPSESDTSTRESTATGHSLHVPHFSTVSSLSSGGGSSASLADSSAPDVKDGTAWALTETVRSICLQGMSYEKLSPADPYDALKAYGTALSLLSNLGTLLYDPGTPSAPASNTKMFLQHRELWRWIERLLWRAITIAARIVSSLEGDGGDGAVTDLWTWLRQYSTCSAYWPSTFRTAHRSTVSVIYLRALVLRYHPLHAGSRLQSHTLDVILPAPNQSGSASTSVSGLSTPSGTPSGAGVGGAWLTTARAVVNDYRAILNACTTFPRAGERNVRVEDFVDLCVAVWEAGEAGGEGTGWVLDILWWATRLTFNSHRVLRHMTRLLHVSGDTGLARRTLLLYAQVVGKAYEASRADVKYDPSPTPDSDDSSRGGLGTGTNTSEEENDVNADTDSDQAWVETLIAGARMLCRSAAAKGGLEGLKEAREAGECIEKAKTRLRPLGKDGVRLKASVDLAEGVFNVTMALTEQDPRTRSARLETSHELFLRACSRPVAESDSPPDPAALYHLALSFARAGPAHDLEQAILHAGRAVEGDPKEIRYWHLFGLLLAAAEKWSEAGDILERGAEVGEEGVGVDNEGGDAAEASDMDTLQVPAAGVNGVEEVRARDFGTAGKAGNTSESKASENTGSVDTHSRLDEPTKPTQNGQIPPSPTPLHASSSGRTPLLDDRGIPPAAELLAPAQDHPRPSKQERFEHALQLRMTQGVLTEVVEGAEGAEEKWLEVFSWVAARRAAGAGEPTARPSVDGSRPSAEKAPSFMASPHMAGSVLPAQESHVPVPPAKVDEKQQTLQPMPIPITISPATPDSELPPQARGKRSSSTDGDTSKSKKVQQMLRNRVHKGQARITTMTRKIGSGVVRTGSLKRSLSTPDFHAILRQTSYQASSIHSRRRISSILHHPHDRAPTESPPPPPTPVPPPPPLDRKRNVRTARADRLIADLWLMSAATFRRLGKIEQAKGAIQEAEVRDEGNPAVWVQFGLYYVALGRQEHALEAFQKALFINQDDVSASVHLARLYLSLHETQADKTPTSTSSVKVDLAAGILGQLTRGNGWDVPEAWYYLAKAYGLQGRKQRERECLEFALGLSRCRGIREIGAAVGWCL
ncbi:putative tetratricopeptide repeat [Lyophyllum shimeji]|uniref:Tetratricopeptide repeat n=1 Tax=Lyophyllum shimeji TaxID=47721 RepID=A0A9P3PS04_LYOSH|nr:putative tetratricopeptide repeat [Lyophyllum shimeji]